MQTARIHTHTHQSSKGTSLLHLINCYILGAVWEGGDTEKHHLLQDRKAGRTYVEMRDNVLLRNVKTEGIEYG